MPPASDSSRLSNNVWRMMRPRLAPSASRTPISFCRAAARAISRLATLAQAISSTRPTMPISTAIGVLNPPRMPDKPRPAGSTTIFLARKRSLKRALEDANSGTDSSSPALICL